MTEVPTPPIMPRYKCHKEVSALQITDVGDALNEAGDRNIYFVDERFPAVICPGAMFARYIPVSGDYLVFYDGDDYQSFSPRRQFENGYTLI